MGFHANSFEGFSGKRPEVLSDAPSDKIVRGTGRSSYLGVRLGEISDGIDESLALNGLNGDQSKVQADSELAEPTEPQIQRWTIKGWTIDGGSVDIPMYRE